MILILLQRPDRESKDRSGASQGRASVGVVVDADVEEGRAGGEETSAGHGRRGRENVRHLD